MGSAVKAVLLSCQNGMQSRWHGNTDYPSSHPKIKNSQRSTMQRYEKQSKGISRRLLRMWHCVLGSKAYLYTCDEWWVFQDLHVGRVIMEPHRNPAVRESACLPFNCPPLLLTSSGTSQLLSNMLDNCLWWSSGRRGQMSRTVTLVSIRAPITFGKASRTLDQQRTNTKSVILPSSLLCCVLCFVFWLLSTTSITFQTLNLNV